MMESSARAATWSRLAVLYFAIAVGLGITMGASGDHRLFSVHAHVNLLGWVSMSLFAWFATAYPATAEGKAATVHFWSYNVGVFTMLVSLTLLVSGFKAIEPVLGVSSALVGLGVLLFVWQVFTRLHRG